MTPCQVSGSLTTCQVIVVPRKLDLYREVIRTRLATYPELTCMRLMEEIRAAGHDGG